MVSLRTLYALIIALAVPCTTALCHGGGALLLLQQDVQEELQLDTHQLTALSGLRDQLRSTENTVRLRQFVSELLTPAQMQRLIELRVQSLGAFALECDDIAALVNLEPQQQELIAARIADHRKQIDEMEPEALSESIGEMRDRVITELMMTLRPDQREAFDRLSGVPCALFQEGSK